jgi:hypothetical protein
MNSNILKMKKSLRFVLLALSLFTGILHLTAQTQYSNYKSMSQKIDALTKEFPTVCSSKSLIKTAGGKDIWVLTVGTGDKDNKPGIAIIGGVEGSHILGKEIAAGFAESILKESSSTDIKALLDKVTFYILPDVSPDATEQFFSEMKYERNINSKSTDDDKDWVSDEDPYEDLNKDGYITLIRVNDPAGKYIESTEDKRVMTEADLSKGQTGNYLVFSEGIDNDKDEKFNEDGQGGINFNRNFTYNYEEFGINSGLYPISEPETKAVADFLFDKFNIYTVFTFGPQDNLGQPMKSSDRANPDRRITSIMKTDEIINKLVSEKYHEITETKGSPVVKSSPGNFMEWAYFHYGRYSFSTPAWWFPVEKDKNTEAQFLKFAEKNKIKDVFVPWTEFNHPDFPGKKTEVGGIKPFAMINPPADTLDALINRNYKFIVAIAAMHPELEFIDVKTENTGEDIFRITLKVHNKGVFATCAEVGDMNSFTRLMRLTFEPDSKINILSGLKVQRIFRLQGNQTAEYSWLVNGKGSVRLTAGALNVGTVTTTIDLK